MQLILHKLNCSCISDFEDVNSEVIKQRINSHNRAKQPDIETPYFGPNISSLQSQPSIMLMLKNVKINSESLLTFGK